MSARTLRRLRSRFGLPLAAAAVTLPMLMMVGAGSADASQPGARPGQSPSLGLSASPTPTRRPHHTPTASAMPTGVPTDGPTTQPTADPTDEPTTEPTGDPTGEPTQEPSQQPSEEPTADPTTDPTPPATSSAAPPPVTVPASATGSPHKPTTVTLDFDGSTVDQLAAGNLLQSLGVRAVFYVNSGRLDAGGDYMSTGQVRALQARGHEIGGHVAIGWSGAAASGLRRQVPSVVGGSDRVDFRISVR